MTRSNPMITSGTMLAYLWAAFWILGPLAASWPHVILGFMLCLPGAVALVAIHSLRQSPAALGILLLIMGTAVAIIAESKMLVLSLGAAPPLLAGLMFITAQFVLVHRNRRQ